MSDDKWPEIEPPEELVLNPWAKHALENPPESIDPDDIDPFTGSPYRCMTPTNPPTDTREA